jgi:hypothetical protein
MCLALKDESRRRSEIPQILDNRIFDYILLVIKNKGNVEGIRVDKEPYGRYKQQMDHGFQEEGLLGRAAFITGCLPRL